MFRNLFLTLLCVGLVSGAAGARSAEINGSVELRSAAPDTTGADEFVRSERAQGASAAQTADALRRDYQSSAEAAADSLRRAGYAVEEVGQALRQSYRLSAGQAAETARRRGYAAADTAKLLAAGYRTSARDTAVNMARAGYAPADIASVLRDRFRLDPATVLRILREAAEVGLQAAFRAVAVAFDLKPDAAVHLLRSLGVGARRAAELMLDHFRPAKEWLYEALLKAGYQPPDTLDAAAYLSLGEFFLTATWHKARVEAADALAMLRELLGNDGARVVPALLHGGYQAAEVARPAVDALGAGYGQLAVWLRRAGVSARSIAAALRDGIHATASQVGEALNAAGFGPARIAEAVSRVFGTTADHTARLLLALGFDGPAVRAAMVEAFGLSLDAATALLLELGIRT